MQENIERGSTFDSVGRIRFENKAEVLTAEQIAEQKLLELRKQKRKKSIKRIIIGLIVVAVLAIIGVIVAGVIRNSPSRVVLRMGDFYFTQGDEREYVANMNDFLDENPDRGFGEESIETIARNDLVMNVALKYYASDRECNIPVSAENILAGVGMSETDTSLEDAFGELSMSNFRLVRAENAVFQNKLFSCVIGIKDIFIMRVLYDTTFMLRITEEERREERHKAEERLKAILPLFQEGKSDDEIASFADMDRRNLDELSEEEFNRLDGESIEISYNQLSIVAMNLSLVGDEEALAQGLTEVGQHTDVITTADDSVIVRLTGVRGGDYATWDDFLSRIKRNNNLTRIKKNENIFSNFFVAIRSTIVPQSAYADIVRGREIKSLTTIRNHNGNPVFNNPNGNSVGGSVSALPCFNGTQNASLTWVEFRDATTKELIVGQRIDLEMRTGSSGGTAFNGFGFGSPCNHHTTNGVITNVLVNCASERRMVITLPEGYTYVRHSSRHATNDHSAFTEGSNGNGLQGMRWGSSVGLVDLGLYGGTAVSGVSHFSATHRGYFPNDGRQRIVASYMFPGFADANGYVDANPTVIYLDGDEPEPETGGAEATNDLHVQTNQSGSPFTNWQSDIFVRPKDRIRFRYQTDRRAWRRETPLHATSQSLSCNFKPSSNHGNLPPLSAVSASSGNCVSAGNPAQQNANTDWFNNTLTGQTYTQNFSLSPTNWSYTSIPNVCVAWRTVCTTNAQGEQSCTDVCNARETQFRNTYSGTATPSARARVPFNYEADTSTRVDPHDIVERGTSVAIRPQIEVTQRNNPAINSGAYATKTHETQWRLIKFLAPLDYEPTAKGFGTSGDENHLCSSAIYRRANYTYNGENVGCNQIGQGSGTYNNNDNLNGWSGDVRNQPIFHEVEDVPVGTQICFATAIYPASSFGEHNVAQQDNNGAMQLNTSNPRWRYGKPSCAIIAKRPRVQFLGAGVNIPNGRIATSHGTKNNTLYGSWSEYEAVAGGRITGLGTGGSFGNYGLPNANAHGRQSWSRQTITNRDDNNFGNYNRGISLSSQQLRSMLSGACSDSHPINYCSNRRDLSGGGTIDRGRIATWVVDGNATITGNITYNNAPYSGISDLPQALIYIKGDLNIHPDVTRIDAWIIVDGNLNTCHGGGVTGSGTTNLNSNICDNKLVFNGSVTAGGVHLRRTGGAGVDNARRGGCDPGGALDSCISSGPSLYPNFANAVNTGSFAPITGIHTNANTRDTSNDPAEVFNLRADNFKWSLLQNRTRPQVRTMYTREIAPRF